MRRELPLQRNDDIEITVDALGAQGQGIGRYEGYAVFVDGALPQERVRAHVIKATPAYAVAKLVRVLAPGPDRVRPPCPYYPRCGGCTLQHASYALQLRAKQQHVQDALTRLGGAGGFEMLPILGMEEPLGYRNKGAFVLGNVHGRVELGLYAARSHRLVPLEECLLQQEGIVPAALAVRDWAREQGVSAYDEQTHQGILRHVLVRRSRAGQLLITVVANKRLPEQESLVQLLRERTPGLAGVVENINPARTNVILGPSLCTLYGSAGIEDRVAGHDVTVSAASFLQVNPTQAERLYAAALGFAGVQPHQRVLDLYCGIGTITLPLACRAMEAVGVESVPAAVEDARKNAARNGVKNVAFYCGDAGEVLGKLFAQGYAPDVAVLDPPRKGAQEAVLTALAGASLPRLVYVSCNPGTLARDVKYLLGRGYRLEKAQPVDMFPQSGHVECVVLMSRVEK